jgi:hypothetical protein
VEFGHLRDTPIFICGHPKSGTTLIQAILDSHPQLVVYPDETFFFQGFVPEIAKRSIDEKLSLAQRYLLHFFEEDSNLQASQSHIPTVLHSNQQQFVYAQTCEAMLQLLEAWGYRHDGDLLSAAILAYGQVHNSLTPETRYWVEKTPYNEFFTDEIFEWWPEARCIHIVRDPRDNYATYLRKHPTLAAEELAMSWNTSLKIGLHSQERYCSQHYLILRYEDLTRDPEAQLSVIVDFLGIRDDEILRVPTRGGVAWQGNSMFGDKFTSISSKPLGRWKHDLSPQDARVIEIMSGAQMKKMGYPFQGKLAIRQYFRIMGWGLKQAREAQREVSKALKRSFGLFPH